MSNMAILIASSFLIGLGVALRSPFVILLGVVLMFVGQK